MLVELNIYNFALIDSLKIEFDKGLNILTGETGAGKSIIIDALGLVLGQRANKENIRQGQDKMIVEALFKITPKNEEIIKEKLDINGIKMEEDLYIILAREVSSSSKSICRINGRMVPLSLMKEISQLLIDIHGQHEHQSLLHLEKHIDLLDSYGGLKIQEYKKTVKNYYSKYKASQQHLQEVMKNEMELAREEDLITFQLEEINHGNLSNVHEDDDLMERRKLLVHSEKLFQNSKIAYGLLYIGTDMQESAYDQLSKAVDAVESISSIDQTMKSALEQLNSAFLQIEDVSHALRNYNQDIEFDPEELTQIEKRLDTINNLKRKYGESISEILKYKEVLQSRLSKIKNQDEEINKLNIEIDKYWKKYIGSAKQLSEYRKSIAGKLENNIIRELQDLGMEKVRFKVDIRSLEEYANYNGIDKIEFMISTNLGEKLHSLAKIASGGEISRIMLALKSILANVDSISSLIFDEIDTGISGRTAQIVAEKLAFISESYQIICITHLPQIASMAEKHYLIEKKTKDNKTTTNIQMLEYTNRVTELARMLGGAILTDLTLSHAKEMLEMAKKVKQIS